MDLFDEDCDGKISIEEWSDYLTHLKRARQLKRTFTGDETPIELFHLFLGQCIINKMSAAQILSHFRPDEDGNLSAMAFDSGLQRMTSGLLAFDLEEVHELVASIDVDGDGEISYDEWEEYVDQAVFRVQRREETGRLVRTSSNRRAIGEGKLATLAESDSRRVEQTDSLTSRLLFRGGPSMPTGTDGVRFMERMPDADKKRWCMLYCGGSMPIIRQLRSVSGKHKIKLKEESFLW
jgi:Ca2+-binding EF-hand superfamily protein